MPPSVPRPRGPGSSGMPQVMQGQIYQRVGEYARGAVLYAFETMGGPQALAEWAKKNPHEFYTKLFTKVVTREVEVSDRRGVDELLDVLDGDYEIVAEGEGGASFSGPPGAAAGYAFSPRETAAAAPPASPLQPPAFPFRPTAAAPYDEFLWPPEEVDGE